MLSQHMLLTLKVVNGVWNAVGTMQITVFCYYFIFERLSFWKSHSVNDFKNQILSQKHKKSHRSETRKETQKRKERVREKQSLSMPIYLSKKDSFSPSALCVTAITDGINVWRTKVMKRANEIKQKGGLRANGQN